MPKFHRAKEGDKIPISDYNLKADYLEALANMKVTGGKFIINRSGAALDVSGGPKTLVYLVRLNQILPKSEGGIATTATAKPLRNSTTSTEAGAAIGVSDTEEIVVVNRNADFTADAGEEIHVARVSLGSQVEWQPLTSLSLLEEDPPNPVPDTGKCGCGCISGKVIPNATVCCTSHLEWRFYDPWTEEERILQYAGSDIWVTDAFDGPVCACDDGGGCNCFGDPEITCANRYQWVLEPDTATGGGTVLYVKLVENNGCPEACLKYIKWAGWQCQCDNTLEVTADWANLGGIVNLACTICISPVPPNTPQPLIPPPICGIGDGEMPTLWQVVPEGLFAGASYNWSGTSIGSATVFQGDWTFSSPFTAGLDQWINLNILEAYPLVYQPGGFLYSTPTPQGVSPSAQGVAPAAANGDKNGVQVGELYQVPPGLLPGSPGTVAPVYGYYGLSIQCTTTATTPDPDTEWTLTITLTMSHSGTYNGYPTPSGGPCNIISYWEKTVTGLLYTDFPCEINQEHILSRVGSTYSPSGSISESPFARCLECAPAGQQNQCTAGFQDDYFDPIFDDLFIPGSITITPYGGGSPECPNPSIDTLNTSVYPDDSGACTTCTPTTGTEDPDDGSCCVDGTCLQYISDALCTSFGGTLYGNDEECADNCILAACCLGGDCTDNVLKVDCDASGGTFIPGALCTGATCQATRAPCCVDGDCYANAATEGECAGVGGTWHPGYSTCDLVPCSLVEGTCCCDPTCCYGEDFTYDECMATDPPSGELYACGGSKAWYPSGTCAADCGGLGSC